MSEPILVSDGFADGGSCTPITELDEPALYRLAVAGSDEAVEEITRRANLEP
jgi:hypothetical protein